jgi:hypothetical protein
MAWCQRTNQQFLIPGTEKTTRHMGVYGSGMFWLVVSTPLKNMKVSWDYYSNQGCFMLFPPKKIVNKNPTQRLELAKGPWLFLVVWGQRLKILLNKQHRTTNVHLNGKNKSLSCAAANEQMLLAKPTDQEELKQSGKGKSSVRQHQKQLSPNWSRWKGLGAFSS